ncbi:MAG: glycosyltransferase family 39 protein [Planctomycetaceae bacterium]|nr:glycosyltransferase family 39 protein [Planctomycetaceae bacterium]
MNTAPPRTRHTSWILGIVLVAVVLRALFVLVRFEELSQDRDLYLGIAQNLNAGIGYCNPGSTEPTAFRPPLYVLAVAAVTRWGGISGLAVLHLLLSGVSVLATWKLGMRLGLRSGSWIAALIVAFDPLLIRYTALPMTETMFTTLVVLTLLAWTYASERPIYAILTGISLGASALCRPTIWPLILVVPTLLCLAGIRLKWSGEWAAETKKQFVREGKSLMIIVGLAFLIALPWGLRNQQILGHFKLTTTHGGYTLLLGNNATFYEAIVSKPLGTTWDEYPAESPLSQTQWYQRLTSELNSRGLKSELELDKAQYDMAIQEIRSQPKMFLKAALLRELRLWSPVPQGPEANQLPFVIQLTMWISSVIVYAAAIAGLLAGFRHPKESVRWNCIAAVLITVMCVHAFYWSNARMRAPLVPLVALLAGRGIDRLIFRNGKDIYPLEES